VGCIHRVHEEEYDQECVECFFVANEGRGVGGLRGQDVGCVECGLEGGS